METIGNGCLLSCEGFLLCRGPLGLCGGGVLLSYDHDRFGMLLEIIQTPRVGRLKCHSLPALQS